MSQVIITDGAFDRINELLISEDNPNLKLRVFVQGGGCSGMEYGFTLDESKNEDDFEIPLVDSKTLLVDATSMQYLSGAVIDYKEDISGSRFIIENPHAETTCGCGSSFSPN
jgi:iron-sulfur cluster insertion protein